MMRSSASAKWLVSRTPVRSSSAITCGFLAGINAIRNLGYGDDKLIDLASQAENGSGLNGGIMDQTAIIKGKIDNAVLIDFLDGSVEYFVMPDYEYSFYLFNSGQKHDLVETGYNKRREECENALKTIQKSRPEVNTLRDITLADIESYLADDISKKRCTHVLQENARVKSVTEALQKRDFKHIGPLLNASHKSLSEQYEVSTPEIDFLVEHSLQIPNVLGSRIMGGGFGGCTINFVHGKLDINEIKNLKKNYEERTGLELQILKISAGDGVRIIKL